MAFARVHLTGVVDDAVKLGIFSMVDEFCRETNVWQETIEFDTIEGNDVVYDLVPTLGTIIRLMWTRQGNAQAPAGGVMDIPGELVLPNIYTPGTHILATVSLAPLDPVDAGNSFPIIADWMWPRYYPAFEDGIVLKMASQPDKPYTDVNLAAYHGRRWRQAIGVARADAVKSNIADGQLWRFPQFAAQRASTSQVN
jgi:hypothetical protein